MKTFLLDIIPRIQRYSNKLDNLTELTNKHWVVIDEELNKKVVFIFRAKENQLLISENGKIEKGNWEYLGNNSLLIDRKDGSYLFKHGFIDDTVLALKVDGKDEYALLVNEQKFDNQLNSFSSILEFLNYRYSYERRHLKLTIPKSKIAVKSNKKIAEIITPEKRFNISDYPELIRDIETINKVTQETGKAFASEIIISFCRYRSISIEHIKANPGLTERLENKELPIGEIRQLFSTNENNDTFIFELEEYLKTVLNEIC
jgi:hypothetical protein